MTDIPSVNEKPAEEIPASEGATTQWVDPIFREQSEVVLADDIDNATEIVDAPAAEADGEKPGADEAEADKKAATEKEKAAEAEDDAEDDDEDDEDDGKTEDAPDKRRPRRNNRSRRERRAAARERALQEKVDRLTTQVETLTNVVGGKAPATADSAPAKEEAAAEETPQPKPKLEDFDFDTDKWADALTEWSAQEITRQIDAGKRDAEKAKEAEAQKAETERRQEVIAKWHERQEAARDRIDDYDDVVWDEAKFIPQAATELIVESEVGPELAYYLGKHQDEAEALRNATPIQVARVIGRIEARLLAEQAPAEQATEQQANGAAEQAPAASPDKQPAEKPARRPVTRAPDPITPVSGSADASRRVEDMDMDEYVAGRRSGKIK